MDEINISAIENAHTLALEMKKESEKYTKLASLALEDEIEVIKNTLRGKYLRWTYVMPTAMKYLQESKRVEADESPEDGDGLLKFNYLVKTIGDLLDCEIEIIDINYLNYSADQYYVQFKVKGDFFDRVFELGIPEVENLNKNNLLELDYGKLQLRYKSSECCWDWVGSSYNIEDLEKKFKDFMTPKGV